MGNNNARIAGRAAAAQKRHGFDAVGNTRKIVGRVKHG
jgi:hypothetical protein